MALTYKMKTCSNCQSFWYFSGDMTQPYPEFACTKEHWDGIGSWEEADMLNEEIDCKDHKLKE